MKKVWKIVLAVAILIYVVCFFLYMRQPVTSEIVKNGTIETSVLAEGFVVRDETLIPTEFSGVLQNGVQEGETVAKGQKVASVYKGKVDQKIQSALILVQQKIDEYQSSTNTVLESDGVKLENQVKQKISEMITATHQRQFDQVVKVQTDLYKLSDKIQVIRGGAKPTTLERLQNEKAALEQQINLEKADIYAPKPGVYTTHLDGLENLVGYKNVANLSVADYAKLENAKATEKKETVAGQPVAKIIGDFDWQFVTVLSDEYLEGLEVGGKLQIRIPDYRDEIFTSYISALNRDENGKVLVAIRCNKASSFLQENRKANVELIFKTYFGLKIPSSALCEVDEKRGVYVRRESFAAFKEAEVLAEQDGFAIVKEDNLNNRNLMLYDEVITNSKDMYDGKPIS